MMSQYNPNLNQALVRSRLVARAGEASRARLVAGTSGTRKTHRDDERRDLEREGRPQARANDVTRGRA